MSVKSYFFNAVEDGGVYDRVYNAEDVTSYLDKIVGNGVFSNPSNSLQVKFIADSQLDVAVLAGQGWIEGHKVVNTSTLQIDLDAADPLLPRIDAIIMYLDLTNRTMGFTFKKGTPAANPTAPSMTRSPNKKRIQARKRQGECRCDNDIARRHHGHARILGLRMGHGPY